MALFINGVGQDNFNMNGVSIDNLYVDDVLVWSSAPPITGEPPIYGLTEPLVNDGSFDYLLNSASSGEQFNAKLLTSGDTAWNPTLEQYNPDNPDIRGTIDFGTNKGDTQWTPPADAEYTFTFIEDVVMDTSYDMVSINPKGDGSTTDVLYDGVLTAENTGLNYTPPTESFKLRENMSKLDTPAIPVCTITMSQYTFDVGETATVTLTFNVEIGHLGLSSIVSADNGSLSTFTETPDKPWEFTATFTPDEDVNDNTNVITFIGNTGGVWDNWNNTSNADAQSANYTVNTGAAGYVVWINWDDQTNDPVGITTNVISTINIEDSQPSDYLDSDGNTTGITSYLVSNAMSNFENGLVSQGGCFDADEFTERVLRNQTGSSIRGIGFNLPAGTFDITVLSSTDDVGTANTTFTLTGETDIVINSGYDNGGSHCGTWAGLSGGSSYDMIFKNGAGTAYLNAVKITKTA